MKRWYDRNLVKKTNLPGFNSFIANGPKEEYQMDIMILNDLKGEDDRKFPYVLVMIDIFDKYCSAIPIKTKQPPDVLAGIMESIHKMGGKPICIYSDNEGSFNSKMIQEYFKTENIRHLTSLHRVPYVDRVIRTLKNMLYKRLDYERAHGNTDAYWYILPKLMLVYNNYKVHSITKFTPKDARKKENIDQVRENLEANRISNRTYPEVHVGDEVRKLKKKDKFDKEKTPVWTKQVYKIEDIVDVGEQKMYKISGTEKPLFRSEILLIPK